MYTLAVQRDFIARHYLIGGDWGAENDPHAHHYRIEVRLEGSTLDKHGYLVDIVDVEHHLDALVAEYRGKMLNDLPEFDGLNPSIEHFSRIFHHAIRDRIEAETLDAITIVIWENDIAWTSYREAV